MRCRPLLVLLFTALPLLSVDAAMYRVYFGTYTGQDSRGIYVATFDSDSGKLGIPELAAECASPSFLAIRPGHKFLYAVGEISNFEGQKAGGVMAFAIDAETGKLQLLNQQSSQGTGPCHISIDRTGKTAVVANYGGGSVASLPIATDGRLQPAVSVIQHHGKSVNERRQEAPHAHSINFDPQNRFAVAADLGLDQVLVYRFDANAGTMAPNNPPFAAVKPGSGPRHFAFHPSDTYAYVINELANTVTAFSFDSQAGTLTELQTISTLPADFHGTSYTAEVVVHPSGKFVYGSNRGHDSLAVFGVDQATGKLTLKGNVSTEGKTPRNFNIDPTGKWLLAANQDSNTVVVFRVDAETGNLTSNGQSQKVGKPVCVRFMPMH